MRNGFRQFIHCSYCAAHEGLGINGCSLNKFGWEVYALAPFAMEW